MSSVPASLWIGAHAAWSSLFVAQGCETPAIGLSQQPEESWGQPDLRNGGKGGEQPRQSRDTVTLPGAVGPANESSRYNESEPVPDVP